MDDMSTKMPFPKQIHHNLFDIVQHLGLLYHVRDPLWTLSQCRSVVKTGGHLLLETAAILHSNESKMVLNGTPGRMNRIYQDDTTWWLPTVPCVLEMLENTLFEPLPHTIRTLESGEFNGYKAGRVSLVAKAIPGSQIDPAAHAEILRTFRPRNNTTSLKPIDLLVHIMIDRYSMQGSDPVSNSPFPLVTIITPSFNQGKFIQETIDSVLQQDYRHIEHIVVDGGSTDNTLSILQRNAQADSRLRYISEPDRGQSHAINKGLAMAQGEIIGWLNSDDTYLPGAIRKAVEALRLHPEWGMVHGHCHVTNEVNSIISPFPTEKADAQKLYNTCCICQPAAFIRRHVFEQMGGVDENLHFCMDYELWMRVAKQHIIGNIPEYVANARLHGDCKSATKWQSVGIPEVLKSLAKHYGSIPFSWVAYASQYQGQGVYTLINKLKTASAHQLPRVVTMNRSLDLWVPPIFRVQIASEPHTPAQLFVIKGRLPAPPDQKSPLTLTALINGHPYKAFPIDQASFQLQIPLDPTKASNVVDIAASRMLSPAALRLGTMQTAGFMAEEVIPLSREEAIVFRAFS